ncbi:MAG: hypothetical protein K9N40_04640 [Candidatus Cloacimonetes bacterium]|nr:hypothetical protein [Candidatus Cloacimonadota bacterium]
MKLKCLMAIVIILILAMSLKSEVVVNAGLPSYQLIKDQNITIPIEISGLTQSIRAFEVCLEYDTAYLSATSSDLTEGSFLAQTGDETQWYASGDNGSLTATCSILGVTSGSSGNGTLFTISLTNLNQDILAGTELVISRVILRDLLNNSVTVDQIDNSIIYIDASPVYLNISLFLEGPYQSGGSMTHALTDNAILPLDSPYDDQVLTQFPDVDPNSIVDWIYIDLKLDENAVADKSANAFLLDNGSVVDVNGNSSLPFYFTTATQYFLQINHRNHLPVMTQDKIILSDNPDNATSLDFTDPTNAFGNPSTNLKKLETEVFGLYSGDANGDGNIFPSDLNDYWRIQTGQSGYKTADFNLDGNVLPTDLNDLWRINSGISSQIPK